MKNITLSFIILTCLLCCNSLVFSLIEWNFGLTSGISISGFNEDMYTEFGPGGNLIFASTNQRYEDVFDYTGGIWPPAGVEIIKPFELPFLMTMILLLSGCTVTWAHHALVEGHQEQAIKALGITVALGAIFLCFQVYEYGHAQFGFTEGVYSSTFYMATGFHGFHVLVGTIFLFVCWRRAKLDHFKPESHFGFEAAAWYWHFVDVVWLGLFIFVYMI